MDDKCTSYRTPVENDFYTELFSTDYRDVDSPVQNAKTDLLCDDCDIEFEQWMYYLIERFAEDADLDAEVIADSLSDKFLKDLKAEFDYLKEMIEPADDDDDDDDEE
jgi:hypothetical protein